MFVDNVKTLISALGYKVLEPLNKPIASIKESGDNSDIEDLSLHLERNIKGVGKVEADGIRTSEGFVVLQGSHIAVEDDDTIPAVLKEKRRKVNVIDGVLQEDVLFSSPSYAAMFVIGKSANGLTSWKDDDGHSLGEGVHIEPDLYSEDKKIICEIFAHIGALKGGQQHKEECFLQFVVDENGKLHYVTLTASMASTSYNYFDEIDEDIVKKHGLVNEISTEMLNAINGMDFGHALEKLMSKQICGFSVGLLKSTTELDNSTASNMRSGKNLTKLNVVSACLGIHVPFPVSSRMLELADLSNRLDVGGAKGNENMVYDQLLHLNWAWDYSDTYDDLVEQEYEYLIHQPPM